MLEDVTRPSVPPSPPPPSPPPHRTAWRHLREAPGVYYVHHAPQRNRPARRRHRRLCPRGGARLLRDRLRDARPDQINQIAAYGGFPHALSALALRHGVRAAQQVHSYGLSKSTKWSSTTIPATPTCCKANALGRPEAGHGPRLRATAISSRTTSGSPTPTAR